MTLLLVEMSTINFGTVVEVKQMSAKDRLERKKYMGMWRWKSDVTTRMMSRFPSTVTRYMDRNSPKRMGCRSGSSEKRMRRRTLRVEVQGAVEGEEEEETEEDQKDKEKEEEERDRQQKREQEGEEEEEE
ncbi:hypothetical protein H920_16788 [Fukomys damarensis]|uniref:Uncharacterized protein n=1 Tax=Fukomys damarensis TaxID=885580 RepID=A0A091CTS6_FUKDA|nr:hypothetical protein H920_16788 [Fukomys damarensis]